MPKPVSLKKVVDEMDSMFDDATAYLNPQTGELFTVRQEDVDDLEDDDPELMPEWQREILPKVREVLKSGDWLALPDKFDIHEWEIMRRFSASVHNPVHRDGLLNALHGGGAFRYFKDTIHRLGLKDKWYAYRDQALEQIAIDFLEAHDISYKKE